ncbi:MAG: YafY family transcriptional regulator [Defluviimonas sp.]|uniref:helix-turn-helix transcriptional regulator n=1 Tax=Albidovulum sp. TaxID=1872424 RepID=UPI001D9B3201|nr:YafY family transcriptional regulator [Paracoccaceae bacterium]MCC0063697.1 YafY family transcriptional regulator [Defluviimonas sp.]
MSKPLRMLDLIALLRAHRRALTAMEIAGRLGVSRRTVYRDIAGLQAMGVPIDGAAGIGFLLRPGFDLPPLNFSAEELEAIIVGLSLLPRTGDAALVSAAASVATKIEAVQPRRRGNVPLPAPGAGVVASGWHGLPDTRTEPALLRRAIREERRLAIAYRDAAGTLTQRSVLPVALIYYVDAVVLAGWCELRDGFRHFRLDRIEDCHLPGGGFAGRGAALRAEWRRLGGPDAPA